MRAPVPVSRPLGLAVRPDGAVDVLFLDALPDAPGEIGLFQATRRGALWSRTLLTASVDAEAGALPLRAGEDGALFTVFPRTFVDAEGERRFALIFGQRPPTDGADPGCNGE